MTTTPLDAAAVVTRLSHSLYVENNRVCFEDDVPQDDGNYVYTYYDGDGYPLYHGYTTDARRRAGEHRARAPWASWVESVRYRPCRTAKAARKLESRLQRLVPSLCHVYGRTRAYHGEDWSDIDRAHPVNHVTGTCRLPGGSCDAGHLLSLLA